MKTSSADVSRGFSKRAVAVAFAVGAQAVVLAGCAGPGPLVTGPTTVQPNQPIGYVERPATGSIYRADGNSAWLFADARRPRNIGDTLKIDIAEAMSGSQAVATDTSRDNKVAAKGPGTGSGGGLWAGLLNMDATASGSDAYKGNGKTENNQALKGKIAASVINVLPNGNLVVAGERAIAMNGGVSTLRISGVVNPNDVQPGGIVASSDVVDARIEQVGGGDLADTTQRSWLQRFFTKNLQVW
jgi:flagellar L-ring protein precursor FlgH